MMRKLLLLLFLPALAFSQQTQTLKWVKSDSLKSRTGTGVLLMLDSNVYILKPSGARHNLDSVGAGGGALAWTDTVSVLATQYDLTLVSGADSTTWVATDYDVSLKATLAAVLKNADSTTMRTYSNSLYLKNADSTSIRNYSNSIYLKNADSTTLKNSLLKNADSTSIRNYSNSIYLKNADSTTLKNSLLKNADSTSIRNYSTFLYLAKADTASLSNRINLKADTVNQTFTGTTTTTGQLRLQNHLRWKNYSTGTKTLGMIYDGNDLYIGDSVAGAGTGAVMRINDSLNSVVVGGATPSAQWKMIVDASDLPNSMNGVQAIQAQRTVSGQDSGQNIGLTGIVTLNSSDPVTEAAALGSWGIATVDTARGMLYGADLHAVRDSVGVDSLTVAISAGLHTGKLNSLNSYGVWAWSSPIGYLTHSASRGYAAFMGSGTAGWRNFLVFKNNNGARQHDGTVLMRVDSAANIYTNGKIGIGGAALDSTLSVTGSGLFSKGVRLNSSGATNGLFVTGTAIFTGTIQDSSSIVLDNPAYTGRLTLLEDGANFKPTIRSNTALYIDAASAQNITFSDNTTANVTITGAGNMGLGTATLGTSAVSVFGIKSGTAPTTGPAGTAQVYTNAVGELLTMDSTENIVNLGAIRSDTNSFTTTGTADTIRIVGATTADKYFLNFRSAPNANDLLNYYTAKADTVIFTRAASGTSGIGYSWLRIR
jgi:hypothetical protein